MRQRRTGQTADMHMDMTGPFQTAVRNRTAGNNRTAGGGRQVGWVMVAGAKQVRACTGLGLGLGSGWG